MSICIEMWSLDLGKWLAFVVLCIAVYKIILGTLETEASADVEWQHARYLRTAKKRKFLSAEWHFVKLLYLRLIRFLTDDSIGFQ